MITLIGSVKFESTDVPFAHSLPTELTFFRKIESICSVFFDFMALWALSHSLVLQAFLHILATLLFLLNTILFDSVA